jgi:DNA invertase Pin-like site-specific DNA recombinase
MDSIPPAGRQYGYARTSTTRQDLDLQIRELREDGCDVVKEQLSAKDANRPRLRELLAHLESGDVLVVYKLDRLSRSLRDVVNILHELSERGVLFRSLHDPIDTVPKADPFAEAMRQATINMLGTFAELERGFIVARTSAGRTHAKASGVPFGRNPVLTPSQVEMARHAVDGGRSVAAVARDLGVHRATLYRYLGDEERADRAAKVLAEREPRRHRRGRSRKRAA